jgi:hypothetical protein
MRHVGVCISLMLYGLPWVDELPRSLSQKRPERGLVDVGWIADLDVPHVLSLAFEEPVWILQFGATEETKLDLVRSRVDVGDGGFPLQPAAIAPLD